jgi:hypothetical protein
MCDFFKATYSFPFSNQSAIGFISLGPKSSPLGSHQYPLHFKMLGADIVIGQAYLIPCRLSGVDEECLIFN